MSTDSRPVGQPLDGALARGSGGSARLTDTISGESRTYSLPFSVSVHMPAARTLRD